MTEKLSEHFTLEELVYSDTAKAKKIQNTPLPVHKKTLAHTCEYCLEKIRALLNEKYKEYKGNKVKQVIIKVTSGYRCPKLNAAIGGSTTSGHMKGECVDIEAVIVFADDKKEVLPFNVLYEDIKAWTKDKKMSVDQCIQEQNSAGAKWVHVGLKDQIKDSRGQFLKYKNGRYAVDCIAR